MEKIIEMLKGLGASEDLAKAFTEELQSYTTSVKSKLEEDYQKKLGKAQKICVEEVQKEKRELARKLKTFLESKAAAFEQAAARQRAIEESQSAALLKKAKAVLENVELKETGATNGKLDEASKTIARLQKACATLKEERNQAVAKANTANDIAAKALQRNRILESKSTVTEGWCKEHNMPFAKDASCAKCGDGDKGEKKDEPKKVDESKQPKRLDESRKVPAGSQAPRRTLNESQAKGSAASRPLSEIDKIAQDLE